LNAVVEAGLTCPQCTKPWTGEYCPSCGYAPSRLEYRWAHALPEDPEPSAQIVEGVIGRVALSILYGDSNSGKTFLAIDLACAIATARNWMGRRTEYGMVVYLATESPRSVMTRLQAYTRHTGHKVGNFCIVETPINLFASATDAEQIVSLIIDPAARTGGWLQVRVGDRRHAGTHGGRREREQR
jgi:hypothetical protein